MKNNTRTRLTAAILCVSTIFFASCAPQNAQPQPPANEQEEPLTPANGAKKILSRQKSVYSSADSVQEMAFAHYEDSPELLLIDTQTAYEFVFESLLNEFGEFTMEETATTLTITRDNGAYCVLDFVADSIYFNNFDLFRVRFYDNMSDILMSDYLDSQGNEIYFKRVDATEIAGEPVLLNLAQRGIPMDIYEGKKYIPFQTVNDLFISPYELNYLVNSEAVFKLTDGALEPKLEELYYSAAPSSRSEALAKYTVDELCLVLDLYYGLQEEHGVKSGFKQYLAGTGLLDDLLSTNPSTASEALSSLLLGYLADMHSDLLMASPYTGTPSIDYTNVKIDSSIMHYWEIYDVLNAAREAAMPEGVDGYQEIGNTAYVTFDAFTFSPERFLDYSEDSKNVDDTIGLIMYAHEQINREGSPIENVVLDLSCNGGGYVDAGIYVVAWMLGYCDFHVMNPVTNCRSTTTYTVDVNLDGVFDERDSIADKNLYCLISPLSFSCANSVASQLKESGRVTLLGNTTGGGSCAVQLMTAADGSLFTISTSYQVAFFSNGSYYNIDQGITPHLPLTKPASYFDRVALTEYINSVK